MHTLRALGRATPRSSGRSSGRATGRSAGRAAAATAALTAGACLVTGCSVGGGTSDGAGGTPDRTVVVATHDSWAMSKKVLRAFTAKTGYTVRIEPNGDAGQLTNKLVLTKGSPIADLTYGIDNTFASRAVDEGILVDYTPKDEPASASAYALADRADAAQLTPVDYGDVCVNIDDVWFRRHRVNPPATLDDLTKPAYRGLFVTPGAATSSPGLAFLLATVAKYGDGWPAYWRRLMANGTKLTSGWSDAYEVDFTAGGGTGDRPIVLSYASSPPFTIPKGATRPTTSSLLDTCFRQVEFAGLLKGARNPAGARAFIDFMEQRSFQEALPENMYVFPVDDAATLPADWSRFAKVAPRPFSLPPSEIARNRDTWLREWGDITSR
ncbi:MAG: thiamine ABC transporter substrate-binding protein [Nocardioidaceae bacterium]